MIIKRVLVNGIYVWQIWNGDKVFATGFDSLKLAQKYIDMKGASAVVPQEN